MAKFTNICCKTVRMIGILLAGYLFLQGLFTICCIQRVTEDIYYLQNNVITQLLGIGLFLLLTLLLGKKSIENWLDRHGNKLVITALALMTVFLVIWTVCTQFWYYTDMELIFLCAEAMLNGEYSPWLPSGYVYMWPHQTGLLLFVALLLKFFSVGNTFLILYGINIIFYVITIVSLILAIRILYQNKAVNCIQGIMLICYLPYSFFCMMMYGNIIGMGFACVSITCMMYYFRDRKLLQLLASAVCILLAVIFKQNEMIILVGLLLLLAFDLLQRKEERRKTAVRVAAYLVIVGLGIQIPNLIAEGITGIETPEGNSRLAHISMGLQDSETAPGWYNSYNQNIFAENNYDKEATSKAALADIKERFREFAENPSMAWSFFHRKLASEWNNPTFECFNIQNSRSTSLELNSLVKSTINDGGKINIILIFLLDIGQSVLLFGILMYLIAADKADLRQLLFCLLFIGGFVFFAFWEAKCQYVLPFFFLLIPYSYLGYRELVQRLAAREKWNKLYTGLAVLGVLIAVIAVSEGQWVQNSFKIHKDTEAYYEYIHQYSQNFVHFRF